MRAHTKPLPHTPVARALAGLFASCLKSAGAEGELIRALRQSLVVAAVVTGAAITLLVAAGRRSHARHR